MGFFLGILHNTPEFLFLPCFRTAWTGYIRSWGNLEVDIIFLCIISRWVCALRLFFFLWQIIVGFQFFKVNMQCCSSSNFHEHCQQVWVFFFFFLNIFLISSLSLELTHYVWVYVQLYIGIFAHLFTKSFNFVVLKFFFMLMLSLAYWPILGSIQAILSNLFLNVIAGY